MAKSRVVIGIDPGTAITGYGLVSQAENGDISWLAHGVITTESDWGEPRRLLHLYRSLLEIVLDSRPDSCAVEKLFFQKNVKTALSVGQGRGAALIALAEAGLPIGEYTPNAVKQAVVGYGTQIKTRSNRW